MSGNRISFCLLLALLPGLLLATPPVANSAPAAVAADQSASDAQVQQSSTPTADDDASDYRYQGLSRRDPFVPLLTVKVPIAPRDDRPLEPLEHYELTQLRLVAVLLGFDKPHAMIKAPDGKAYIVTVGNRLGKNRGVITAITKKAVVLKETYYDYTGNIKSSEKQLKLTKREGA